MGLVEGGAEGKQGWWFRFALSDGRLYEERLDAPTLPVWLSAHVRAFESLSGVPPTIELVVVPPALHEECTPLAWADLVEHYAASPRAPSPDGLLPLPEHPYAIPAWKTARLHPDCHVLFDGSFYSAPYRLIGRVLVIRGTRDSVDLYDRGQRVAHHPRALRRGERRSIPTHYPPPALAPLLPAPRRIRHDAERVGPSVARLVDTMLADRPVDALRGAQGIVNLARRHGIVPLEVACRWALNSGQPSYRAVRYALKARPAAPGAEHGTPRNSKSSTGPGRENRAGSRGEPEAASPPS
jgi:hypothetical protein